MKKRSILFRADGNNEIGLGHVYRCLAIADRLSTHFDCKLAIVKPSTLVKEIISKTINVVELDSFLSLQVEAQHLATFAADHAVDIITLDGYKFDTAYQQTLKDSCDAVLVCIDDDQPFAYVADVVINHAPAIKTEKITRSLNTKVFLGSDYSLLRKEFSESNNTKYIPEIRSVLICFGGGDPLDFTGEAVRCISKSKAIQSVTVITGAAYEHNQTLERTIRQLPNVVNRKNLDAVQMVEEMEKADLAIVPASTIALEAFTVGMVLITGTTSANQQNIYDGLITADRVLGIGNFETMDCDKLLSTLETARGKFRNFTHTTNEKSGDNLVALYNSI